MRILSFDCANKSLAVCGIFIDKCAIDNALNLITKLNSAAKEIADIIGLGQTVTKSRVTKLSRKYETQYSSKQIEEIFKKWRALISELPKLICAILSIWKLEYQQSFDLLPGKKVRETEPVERCVALKSAIETVRANYPGQYDLVVVEDQMNINEKSRGVFYCLLYEFGSVARSIKAHEKNKLALGGHYRCNFLAEYASAWSANKAHSRANFQVIAAELGLNVPKKHIADIADAYFQAIAYTIINRGDLLL